MSEVRPDVDLSALARQPPVIQPPRRGCMRWLLPLVILLGFLAVLASVATDLLRPARDVTVLRPRALDPDAARAVASGTVVAQAAGWVEPDPFPIHVTALAAGVVADVLVQESDVVERGQVVAHLIDEDARLAHVASLGELARAQAEVSLAEAELRIASASFEAALGVTERAATTGANVEGKEAEALHRSAAVKQGEARLRLAEDELAVQRELEALDATGSRQVDIARARVEEEQALLEILHADAALAAADAAVARAAHDRALGDVEHRFEDRLAVDTAQSRLDRARAEVARLEAARDEALLRLERMAVRAPADGVVLERLATPGSVVSPGRPSEAICNLYDPTSLRVRVDVPLADVGRLFVGQRATIEAGSRPRRPYEGEVLRIVQLADIQKVTLEAQVRVIDPDALVRPDMLVQVRFLGAAEEAGAGDGEDAGAPSVVLAPRRLVEDGAVWVVDPGGVAARRAVDVGASDGDWVEVRSGLNLSDKVIDRGRAGLAAGDRVRIREGR